eukprot:1783196-Prymnesium_polylepis.1
MGTSPHIGPCDTFRNHATPGHMGCAERHAYMRRSHRGDLPGTSVLAARIARGLTILLFSTYRPCATARAGALHSSSQQAPFTTHASPHKQQDSPLSQQESPSPGSEGCGRPCDVRGAAD